MGAGPKVDADGEGVRSGGRPPNAILGGAGLRFGAGAAPASSPLEEPGSCRRPSRWFCRCLARLGSLDPAARGGGASPTFADVGFSLAGGLPSSPRLRAPPGESATPGESSQDSTLPWLADRPPRTPSPRRGTSSRDGWGGVWVARDPAAPPSFPPPALPNPFPSAANEACTPVDLVGDRWVGTGAT